jgi:lantibiotic modifying enzyme
MKLKTPPMPFSKALIVLVAICLQVLPNLANRPSYPLPSPSSISQAKLTAGKAALQAAEWIRGRRIRSTNGMTWPADPDDPETVDLTLYTGMPGIVLFFLQVYKTTGDKSYLINAQLGADHLVASLEAEKRTGLYLGISGIGFVLQETFKVTKKTKYRDGAQKCVQLLRERSQKTGAGVQWNDVTDVISGISGTGLFLLYAAHELKDKQALDLATGAGERLIELGRPENGGLKWAMSPTTKNLMPNFSHGTAGTAYFLATLYERTRKRKFLDAALKGAVYLKSIAETEGETCSIFHNEGEEGKHLHYLGWCHGPAGTARLFYRLYRATGDSTWLRWTESSARSVLKSGIPDRQLPGFWNNVSQCCGNAGIAEFFLDLFKITRKAEYLRFATRMTDNLLARSTREGRGLKWIQAENRTAPDSVLAQTGYMQGAAGIGMELLHLDSVAHGKQWKIRLPDSPFE